MLKQSNKAQLIPFKDQNEPPSLMKLKTPAPGGKATLKQGHSTECLSLKPGKQNATNTKTELTWKTGTQLRISGTSTTQIYLQTCIFMLFHCLLYFQIPLFPSFLFCHPGPTHSD